MQLSCVVSWGMTTPSRLLILQHLGKELVSWKGEGRGGGERGEEGEGKRKLGEGEEKRLLYMHDDYCHTSCTSTFDCA